MVLFFRKALIRHVEPKIFQKRFKVLEIESQINAHLLKMSLYNMTI